MSHSECQMLFEAGRALVEKSGLAHYRGKHFVACKDRVRFEKYWEKELHRDFGRYMAWVLFSVGGENLAKAACVCNGVTVDPRASLGWCTRPSHHYFECLSTKIGLLGGDKYTLHEGYRILTDVRNRDAHTYHKDVRDADFTLVEESFVPAFDIVVKAIRQGGHPPLESR